MALNTASVTWQTEASIFTYINTMDAALSSQLDTSVSNMCQALGRSRDREINSKYKRTKISTHFCLGEHVQNSGEENKFGVYETSADICLMKQNDAKCKAMQI